MLSCGRSITGDLWPHRPLQAEFRGASPRLKLGHTSSGGILLAKAPFIPSAVPCLFGSPQEFDLLCPGRKLCKRYSVGLSLEAKGEREPAGQNLKMHD